MPGHADLAVPITDTGARRYYQRLCQGSPAQGGTASHDAVWIVGLPKPTICLLQLRTRPDSESKKQHAVLSKLCQTRSAQTEPH